MRKILLISPHFDDAVLSAGQFMAGRPNADVVTVFAGKPVEMSLSDYDAKCGFTSSSEAVEARRLEDKEAMAVLGASPIHWRFTDSQYAEVGQLWDNLEFSIGYEIMKQVEAEDYEFIVCPLGLGHPDHITVADAVRSLKRERHLTLPVYFWEDLPLRVLEPELVSPRLLKLGLKNREFIGDGSIKKKRKAINCYKSQIGTGVLTHNVIFVPERFWKLK